ncbi:MAG: DUF3991 domain-containing protein [Planctomycetota bacterium]
MTFDDFRRRADRVRQIPLETVLKHRDAVRDRRDRAKWHTEQGPLSISGAKFTNWHRNVGGGGAIDLVMHLARVDCREAVAWLEQHFGTQYAAASPVPADSSGSSSNAASKPRQLRLPVPEPRNLRRVRRYLIDERHLAADLVEALIEAGKLYADQRGNAVFLLVAGKANRPVGAELRGTGGRAWRGMAPGTRKEAGYFWVGAQGATAIVLCESAIDAISCFRQFPDRICISTAGARANPAWLRALIGRGYAISCGFDCDAPGETAARAMIALHPTIDRLQPPAHDWNEALAPCR